MADPRALFGERRLPEFLGGRRVDYYIPPEVRQGIGALLQVGDMLNPVSAYREYIRDVREGDVAGAATNLAGFVAPGAAGAIASRLGRAGAGAVEPYSDDAARALMEMLSPTGAPRLPAEELLEVTGRGVARGGGRAVDELLGSAVIRPDNLFRGEGVPLITVRQATQPFVVRTTGQDQIDDMIQSGLVRPKVGGYGKEKKSDLYFGQSPAALPTEITQRPSESRFALVGDSEKLAGTEGPIPIDQLRHVWVVRNGETVDVLPDILRANRAFGSRPDAARVPDDISRRQFMVGAGAAAVAPMLPAEELLDLAGRGVARGGGRAVDELLGLLGRRLEISREWDDAYDVIERRGQNTAGQNGRLYRHDREYTSAVKAANDMYGKMMDEVEQEFFNRVSSSDITQKELESLSNEALRSLADAVAKGPLAKEAGGPELAERIYGVLASRRPGPDDLIE